MLKHDSIQTLQKKFYESRFSGHVTKSMNVAPWLESWLKHLCENGHVLSQIARPVIHLQHSSNGLYIFVLYLQEITNF